MSRRVPPWAAPVLLAALVLWQVGPMISPHYFGSAILGTDSYRSHDWLEVAKLDRYARESLLEWKSFPLWNPLLAGGMPQLAHPSDGSSSPLILSSLALGEIRGMKLNVVLVALLGTLGMFFLLRRSLDLSVPAAFVGAAGYAWAGWLPSRVAVGFYESCLMAAWPAILALWLAPGTMRERRRRWVLAALLLWTLAIQLQLAVPVLVLLMVSLAAVSLLQGRLEGRALDRPLLLGGALILALGGALGAVKFLPMLEMLDASEYRKMDFYPSHPDAWYRNFDQLWYGLFHRVPGRPLLDADGGPRIQEYMTLAPGLGTLLLAALGALSIRSRSHRALPWLVVTLLFLWLSFGPHAPVDAFRPLHSLPLFSSMRGPLRYLNYPLLLGLCVLAGVGFQALVDRLPSARPTWLVPGLVASALLLSLPNSLDVRKLYRSSFLYGIEDLPHDPALGSEGLRGRSSSTTPRVNLRKYANTRRGLPTIYVPEDLPFDVQPLPRFWVGSEGQLEAEPDYRGEIRVEPPEAGSARIVARQAQLLVVEHDLVSPGRIVMNSNDWPGWRCEGRQLIRSEGFPASRGLLSFGAPPGQGLRSVCRWSPPKIRLGLGLSGLGFVGLLLLWPWRTGAAGRRKPRSQGKGSGAPGSAEESPRG